MRPLRYLSALLLLGVAVAAAAAPAVPIGCTVIMYSSYDYTLQGDGRSKCIAIVESAKQTCGGTRLNFIPTLYFGFTNKKLDRYCTDSGDGCAQVRQPTLPALNSYAPWYYVNRLVHKSSCSSHLRLHIKHKQHRPPSPTSVPILHPPPPRRPHDYCGLKA
jgi:hypothetical protein